MERGRERERTRESVGASMRKRGEREGCDYTACRWCHGWWNIKERERERDEK